MSSFLNPDTPSRLITMRAPLKDLGTVVLLYDVEDQGLERGDTGAVVHRYANADAYEVEFVTGEGKTVAILTLGADEVLPMDRHEILHTQQKESKSHTMYDIGEKPGKGRYCCTNCGWSVRLDDSDDRLPPCGNCDKGQDTTYRDC